ncbi:MAG: hypothetical protein R8P61_10540 [Bacteroidia bacterium]|nr:hypothetical protein [Bacteroidia bacterium]
MNPKITSILLILLTLMIGFAGGFITRQTLHDNRMKEMREKFSKKDGHVEYFKRVMEITPEQEAAVQPILEDYAPRVHQHMRRFWDEARLRTDSMAIELAPHISEDQIEKLKRRLNRKRHHKKKPKEASH